MALMRVVGERGVSTGVAPPSRTGHTSTSGLEGSSLTLTDWLSLQVKRAEEWLLQTNQEKNADIQYIYIYIPDIKKNQF